MAVVFERIAILGAGLIGGSIARAACEAAAVGSVAVYDADASVRQRAHELGLGEVRDTAAGAVLDADLVVLAVPVGAMASALTAAAPALKPGAIVSDVGSVKQAVIEAVQPLLPANVFLIPGHPIA